MRSRLNGHSRLSGGGYEQLLPLLPVLAKLLEEPASAAGSFIARKFKGLTGNGRQMVASGYRIAGSGVHIAGADMQKKRYKRTVTY
jgi:hypothetical protein